jgi:hypothetical protein
MPDTPQSEPFVLDKIDLVEYVAEDIKFHGTCNFSDIYLHWSEMVSWNQFSGAVRSLEKLGMISVDGDTLIWDTRQSKLLEVQD